MPDVRKSFDSATMLCVLTLTPPLTHPNILGLSRIGAAIRNLLEKDIKPRDIMTRKAFENAITITMALGMVMTPAVHFDSLVAVGLGMRSCRPFPLPLL